jgi:outer membrane protein TolC
MRVGVLVLLWFCGSWLAWAQPVTLPANPRSISLQECVEMALNRNLDLQIEHLSTDISHENLLSSYGVYVPNLSFTARRDYLSEPANFDPKKAGLDAAYQMTTDTIGPGLDGKLPYGLSYDLNAMAGHNDARTDFNSNTNNANDFFFGIRNTNNYFAETALTLRQHLLKDFWIDKDWQTVQLKRKDVKISEEMLRFQIMRTVLAVEMAYYDLIAARENIGVAQENLELKQQFVAEMRRRVEVGDSPPLDGEQAETQLQNALSGLVIARDNAFERETTLKTLISDSFDAWANVELSPSESLTATPVEPDRVESSRLALKNRPDLVEARLVVEKNDVVVKFSLNQLYPAVDLIGGYGSHAVNATSSSASISDAVKFLDPAYTYGVVATMPLSNFAERGNYRASKAARSIAELQLKKAEQDVLVQVAVWVHRIQSRFALVGYTTKARAYAESALAAEEKKLSNGFSTPFVVLQLQEALTSARTAEVQAMVDYNKSLAQLAFAEGTTLEKHRLMLQVK